MAKYHSPRFLKITEAALAQVHEVSIDDLKRRLDLQDATLRIIDIREDHEWVKGRLPQAIHLGRGILERDIEQLIPDVNQELILYCGGGFRSALAAESLQKMGYTKVYSLADGYRGWTEKGYPTETTP